MPADLLILADTHVPKRARDLPAEVWRAVDQAEVVIHAGDWVDVRLLDSLERRARRLVGVYGNNDHGVLRERLPEVARVEIDGIRFGVVHETGPAQGRERRCSAQFPDVDVLVFGHSHIPSIFTLEPDGIQVDVVRGDRQVLRLERGRRYLVNPGSVGQPRDRNISAAYAVYDSARREIQFGRVPYDVASARAKIVRAGLPEALGDRLLIGA